MKTDLNVIRDKYTFIKPCCVQDTPDAHTVWLKVGPQSFCVTSLACDTKQEAEWFQERLAGALFLMVKELAMTPFEMPPSLKE